MFGSLVPCGLCACRILLHVGSPTEFVNISVNMPAIEEEPEVQPEIPPLSPEVSVNAAVAIHEMTPPGAFTWRTCTCTS